MDPNVRELYQEAVAEDRFQVQLNWDRTKFAVAVNGSIFGGAAALAGLSDHPLGRFLAALVFVAGAFAAAFGIKAARDGKRYHRAANVKKVLYERRLGLHEPIPGTAGQYADLTIGAVGREKQERILADVDAYVTPGVATGSVTGAALALLRALFVLDILSALVVLYIAAGCPWPSLPCT